MLKFYDKSTYILLVRGKRFSAYYELVNFLLGVCRNQKREVKNGNYWMLVSTLGNGSDRPLKDFFLYWLENF